MKNAVRDSGLLAGVRNRTFIIRILRDVHL